MIKLRIYLMRRQLNALAAKESLDHERLYRVSCKLDKLINLYYRKYDVHGQQPAK